MCKLSRSGRSGREEGSANGGRHASGEHYRVGDWGPVADNAPLRLRLGLHFSSNDENIFFLFLVIHIAPQNERGVIEIEASSLLDFGNCSLIAIARE